MKTAQGVGNFQRKAANRFDSQFLAMFISWCRQFGFAHDAINSPISATKILLATADGWMENSKQRRKSPRAFDEFSTSKTEKSADETCHETKLSVKSGRRTHIRSAYIKKPDAPFLILVLAG